MNGWLDISSNENENENKDEKENIETYVQIAASIKQFIGNTTKGRDNNLATEGQNVVYNACTSFAGDGCRRRIGNAIGLSYFYMRTNTITNAVNLTRYSPINQTRVSPLFDLQKQCIRDFCHSEESLSIDSNFSKTAAVTIHGGTVEHHAQRVFLANTFLEMYQIFLQSESLIEYNTNHPNFSVPSLTTFKKY